MALCPCPCASGLEEKKQLKELWRLRLNWVFVAALSLLASVSNTSISSSFHQFVINPMSLETEDNATWTEVLREFGLGQSEMFYSWLIAVFNFGSVFGAILSGFLVKCLPYWYLYVIGLVAHISGFLIYVLTYEGWLILISKFLSGYFLGVQWSLGISYVAKSSEEYVAVLQARGKRVDDGSVERVKRFVFSSQTVGTGIGFIVGPGAAVVFAQYPIDQFRAIAWYNVAIGAALLLLQVLIFRGETKCNRLSSVKNSCLCVAEARTGIKNGPLGVFIVVSFQFFLFVSALRFGYFETLFNPVLSDSFGFDERDSSYYFFALVWPYLGGVVTLVLLQKAKLSNQLIAIIGIAMTFTACILSADWQAIPPDPCTDFSPFHRPELIPNHSNNHSKNRSTPVNTSLSHFTVNALSHFTINAQLESSNGSVPTRLEAPLNCEQVETCDCTKMQNCIYHTQGSHSYSKTSLHAHPPSGQYLPRIMFSCQLKPPHVTLSLPHQLLDPVCVFLYRNRTELLLNGSRTGRDHSLEDVTDSSLEPAHIQELTVLTDTVYNTSRHNCEHANVTTGRCHWIPSSVITGKECSDCQPICRNTEQTLTFWQFVLGTSTLMAALPLLWVSLVAISSIQVRVESQGLLGAAIASVNSVSRGVGPLILDPAYEGMQKRTFLAMLILVALHLPMLVVILVLYSRLGPESGYKTRYTRLKSKSNDEQSSDTESIE